VAAVQASGLRVTGFQVLRDFEGLSGHLHEYKIDIAKAMLEMCACAGLPHPARVLVHLGACLGDLDAHRPRPAQAGDAGDPDEHPGGLRGAVLGPHGQRVHHRLGAGRRADMPNLGLGFDSFHMLATQTPLDDLELLDPAKIFLVQLADFMWNEIKSVEERITTARQFRVFPGEGVHSAALADVVTLKLHQMGYRGDYSFEVFNDDYQQLPLDLVARRARASALWLGESVLRRSVPLPNKMRLRARAAAR
jgi:sugar phosphate isomerase/epimerase